MPIRSAGRESDKLVAGCYPRRSKSVLRASYYQVHSRIREGLPLTPERKQEPGRIGMPIAGDDADAVAVASRLCSSVGWRWGNT